MQDKGLEGLTIIKIKDCFNSIFKKLVGKMCQELYLLSNYNKIYKLIMYSFLILLSTFSIYQYEDNNINNNRLKIFNINYNCRNCILRLSIINQYLCQKFCILFVYICFPLCLSIHIQNAHSKEIFSIIFTILKITNCWY